MEQLHSEVSFCLCLSLSGALSDSLLSQFVHLLGPQYGQITNLSKKRCIYYLKNI